VCGQTLLHKHLTTLAHRLKGARYTSWSAVNNPSELPLRLVAHATISYLNFLTQERSIEH